MGTYGYMNVHDSTSPACLEFEVAEKKKAKQGEEGDVSTDPWALFSAS